MKTIWYRRVTTPLDEQGPFLRWPHVISFYQTDDGGTDELFAQYHVGGTPEEADADAEILRVLYQGRERMASPPVLERGRRLEYDGAIPRHFLSLEEARALSRKGGAGGPEATKL